MTDWLAERAASTPDAETLVDATTDRTWTAAELDDAATTTARRLAGRGVGPGDHVGLLMETRPAFVRVAHAVWRLGAVLVPLNVRLATPGLRSQVDAADVTLLVCEADTAAAAREASGDVPAVCVDAVADLPRLADAESGAVDRMSPDGGDTAALLFTSGTTGAPKPVRLTAGNLEASATASAFRLGVVPGDRWCCPLSLYHTGGLSVVVRTALYGTTAVLHAPAPFDPEAVLATLSGHGCTGVSLVPTMLDRLLDAGDLPDSLRFVLLGGAPASNALVERCERRAVPVCPTYGLTETASQVATARPAEAFENPGTVGRPLFRTSVTVVDGDGSPLPPGEAGELVVAGPTVTPGYYGAREAEFGPHGLHTGDVGHRDADGRLWVNNRLDDRIVTGGENVDPGAVTDALREHPDVADAAVVGVPDPEWGERVAALVVPATGADVDAGTVRAHCEDRLAGYERPRTLAVADDLPRTASGTVDREAVRERLAEASEETGDGQV